MIVRQFKTSDEPAVVRLWQDCGLVERHNDPAADIMRKIEFQPELFFVAEDKGRVIGSVMAGYEGHRGWINYLAVSPDAQRGGVGRALMEAAEVCLGELGCPKVNLQVRSANDRVVEFYRRLGYGIEDRISFGKRLDSEHTPKP